MCLKRKHYVLFYQDIQEVSRLEKTEYISDFAVTHKYLNVCWYHLYNCNKCDKCRRTMLGLYALGKLDRYGEVFDIKYFYQNRDEYLGHMLRKWITEKNESYYDEINQCCIERNIKIPKTAKIYALKLLFSSIKNKVKELKEA